MPIPPAAHYHYISCPLQPHLLYTLHTEAVSLHTATVLPRYKLYLALAGDGDTDTADTEPGCEEECPEGSHCSWGVCFCDAGQY